MLKNDNIAKITDVIFTFILLIIGQQDNSNQPGISVCVHELYMCSIKTFNSWFLRNLTVTTSARWPPGAFLLKQ